MTPAPPRALVRLLSLLLPDAVGEPLLGDLEETFHRTRSDAGLRRARAQYWREGIRAILLLARPRWQRRAVTPTRGDGPMHSLLADLRYALRQFARRPAQAALMIGTLALGIGATTAIFSAVQPVLFAPLPYPHAERLVTISERAPDGTSNGIGYATFEDITAMSRSLDATAAFAGWTPTLTGHAEPEQLAGQAVSLQYFRVLGVAPALGRDFRPEEDVRGAARVAVLSHALWRNRFGGDPALIGKTITLSEVPFTVIGVMPPGFENVVSPTAQIWTTLRYNSTLPFACRTCHHIRVIARLRDGLAPAAARTELESVSARLVAEHPTEYAAPGLLVPRLADQVTQGVRPALSVIFGAVLLLLIIACANVTSLLLARATQRQSEFSVRTALGASRARLVRQLLSESLLMVTFATIVGLALAVAGVRALIAIAPANLPRLDAIAVNRTALLFAVAVATVVGLGFGLVPALHASRRDVALGIRQGKRLGGGRRAMTRGTLVVVEVALALMLMIGAGLMVRTMRHLLDVSPGFRAANTLTLQVQTTGGRYSDSAVTLQFYARALDAIRAIPGVDGAAYTSQLPLSTDFDGYGMHIESRPNPKPETDPSPFRYAVSAGYLDVIGIPVRRGRGITEHDDGTRQAVALINESFARRLWPGGDPIGERIRLGAADRGPWFTIVGITGDVRQVSLAAPVPDAVYIPELQWQYTDGVVSFVVTSKIDPAILAPLMRQAIWAIDAGQPIVRVATLDRLVAATEAQRTFTLRLISAFAAVALALAAAGIYGVLSGTVNERVNEIGVRTALGASRRNIVWLVVRDGAALTGLGLAIGYIASALLSRMIGSLLFGIPRIDVATYLSVTAVLAGVAVAASWLPAWRATRIDPAITLRAE